MNETNEKRTLKEMLMYKWDRTLAIAGVIGIAVVALNCDSKGDLIPVVRDGMTILGIFLGIKVATK